MAKIFIENKEIKFKVQEQVEQTSFDIIDGKYVENTSLTRKYISDIYAYLDFNVLFAMENLFDQFYIKIILFNDEKKVGYNLISLSNNLDISIKRVSPENFIVLGVNKDQEMQGQASFCSLKGDGTVGEVTINFNYINQYKVIEKKYFLLNFIEVVEVDEFDDEGNAKKKKHYINTIGLYNADGTIVGILFEETLNIKRELFCDVNGDNLIIYYKDDGSVVKKDTITNLILSSQ